MSQITAARKDRVESMTQLALDFVRGLMTPEQACERNGFTRQEAKSLLNNLAFQELMQSLKAEWLDTGNAAERARAMAGVALEDGVDQLYRMMHGEGGGPDGRVSAVQVEAVKALARIAGVGVPVAGAGMGGGAPAGAIGAKLQLIFNFRNAPPQEITGAIIAQDQAMPDRVTTLLDEDGFAVEEEP